MGNVKSNQRRCVSAFSMDDGGSDSVWTEPLLDASERKQLMLQHEEPQKKLDLPALIHQLNSFFAVLWPVCITMVLASFIACYAKDEELAKAMTTYMYYKNIDSSEKSVGEKSMLALFNGLFVIGFIACLTFTIVLLYKFDCMKLFLGYCVLYSASLLGMAGGKIAVVVFGTNLHWLFDCFSLWFVMYNFSIVGVLSIFYQKGIPTAVEQGYLICISVIVAWQLSQLPEWSIWMILLLLGFWDMFAVLTPVGPLRWLVDLVHEKGTPLPGLLFKADIVDSHKSSALVVPVTKPTRATMSEGDFVEWLLSASAVSVRQPSPPAHVLGVHHQVVVFLYDQQSTVQYRALDLSRTYNERQVELWQKLYTYYGVQVVTSNKPYPPVDEIFPSSPSPLEEQRAPQQPTQDDEERDSSIRLGLGDFIFYSVLVARAAMHGFAAFAACFLSVLIGLAITMYLLAHYDALPALPFSIFSGIFAFVVSVELVSPFLEFTTLS